MSDLWSGKVIWITGGGSGIGRATALEFARHGAKVAVSGRRLDRLEETVKEIGVLGAEGLAVVADVAKDEDIERAIREVVAKWGGLDVVFANAGFGVAGPIEKLSRGDWRRQFEVNVFGLVMTARLALPELRKTAGRLILMGSVASYVNPPTTAPYSSSKHAVRAIGETLTLELKGSGVTCTTVHPGFVESEIGQVDNEGRFREDWKDYRPARLMWRSEDAARVIVRAAEKRKRQCVFTLHGLLAAFFGQHLPGLTHWAIGLGARKVPPKGE
jgi:NAD(P)-dependent dehydrogenase (short-subunit alcohol dehydrogenase family)